MDNIFQFDQFILIKFISGLLSQSDFFAEQYLRIVYRPELGILQNVQRKR